MTGWQLVACYGLTLLAFVLLFPMPAPPQAEVELEVTPPIVIYVQAPPLPDRNPLRH